MDEPKLPASPLNPSEPVGQDPAPVMDDDRRLAVSNQKIAASSRDHVETPAEPLRENSHVAYCDNAEEVREGFAIALRIMGLKQSQ